MRIALFRANVFRILITLTFVWVASSPCAYAGNNTPGIDKPSLQELVQTSSVNLVTESQQVIKSAIVYALSNRCLARLPERELATSPELFICASERNPFYLLPTIHAP